jgi:hypothetical protein
MKIIFLDFDGVMNNELWFIDRVERKKIYNRDEHEKDAIDPRCVDFLNKIIEDTGAKVVVSSTWRMGRSKEELQRILEVKGFKGEVVGKTDMLRGEGCLRGNEIRQWQRDNAELIGKEDENRYVILDDDSDMLYWQRNNMIIVDPYCGITPRTVYKATKILNGNS